MMLAKGEVIYINIEEWCGFAIITYADDRELKLRWIMGPPQLYFKHGDCDAYVPASWYPEHITKVSIDE